ncbi:MAG: hypothetical protein ACQESQ_07580 [Bacteroidota bacterium]
MNFKKKAIIGIAAGLFAVATVFNMNMLNENGAGDVSLDAIALMAQANPEGYPDECPADWTQNNCRGDDGILYANATRK